MAGRQVAGANVKVTQAGGLGGVGNLHHAYIIRQRSKIKVKSVLKSGHSSYILYNIYVRRKLNPAQLLMKGTNVYFVLLK